MSKKIVVIDDDQELLNELSESLTINGYEVVGVNDASLVLEVIHKTKPDVILLDLNIPKQSGFEIALELKYFSRLNHVPIIAMTGFFNDDAYISLMNLCGIQDCLKKPFNIGEVITQIEHYSTID